MKMNRLTSVVAMVALMASSATCFADGGDTYNASKNQLLLPSFTYGGNVYTNLVITVGSIVSVGGSTPVATSSSSGPITLAQLNACPNTNTSSSAQFWSCFSGTMTGVETGQTYPCTLTIGNGHVTLTTTDQNMTVSFSPVNPTYSKTPSGLPGAIDVFSPAQAYLANSISVQASSYDNTYTAMGFSYTSNPAFSMVCSFTVN